MNKNGKIVKYTLRNVNKRFIFSITYILTCRLSLYYISNHILFITMYSLQVYESKFLSPLKIMLYILFGIKLALNF